MSLTMCPSGGGETVRMYCAANRMRSGGQGRARPVLVRVLHREVQMIIQARSLKTWIGTTDRDKQQWQRLQEWRPQLLNQSYLLGEATDMEEKTNILAQPPRACLHEAWLWERLSKRPLCRLHFGHALSLADVEDLRITALLCYSLLHRSLDGVGSGRSHLVLLNI